jgi:hypothetical protein
MCRHLDGEFGTGVFEHEGVLELAAMSGEA